MKIFGKKFSRKEYAHTQINRGSEKFHYCKVSYDHVKNWQKILIDSKITNIKSICCLGTRSGREIDLFRIVFNDYIISSLVKLTEIKRHGWKNIFNFLLNYKRSNLNKVSDQIDVHGVEINPMGKRIDTLIASFDELPAEWEGKYDLIYSNSFDQSMDPEKTVKEWKRILKKNSIIIFSFGYDDIPTETDPVGGLNFDEAYKLFGGEVIYYNKYGSHYSDLILRI